MLSKLKNYIRYKLGKFLGIDDLLNMFDKHIDRNEYEFYRIDRDMFKFNKSINVLHDTIESVVHIGTDVDMGCQPHSWAVVCIEGKMNVVKFIDLKNKDAKEILDFLKCFDAGRHCIDAPSKDIFNDGLFKFEIKKELPKTPEPEMVYESFKIIKGDIKT